MAEGATSDAAHRLPPVPEANWTAEQRAVVEEMAVARQSAGSASLSLQDVAHGPYEALLYSPTLYDSFARAGNYLMWGSALPPASREIAILLAAHRWRSSYYWYAHSRIAAAAGVKAEVIEAIRRGERPQLADPVESATYDMCVELLTTGTVTDDVFAAVRRTLGEAETVDLVGAVGYWTWSAFLLNADGYRFPPGMTPANRNEDPFA